MTMHEGQCGPWTQNADKPLTPQQEQVVRMRRGLSLSDESPIDLAGEDNSHLRQQLLQFEAQVLARAPQHDTQPKRQKPLRLVSSQRRRREGL